MLTTCQAAHTDTGPTTATLDKPPEDPSALPGEMDGLSLRVETDRPLEEVARLTDAGVHFTRLRVDRPDLEAVFLNLTGRRLRN